MGPKGIGDMQAAKRDKMRHLRRYTDLSVMGVRVAASTEEPQESARQISIA